MDHADIAGDVVEVCTAEAEARARGKSAPETYPGFDGNCVDCGEEIHVARLALGKIRCVVCQQRLEKEDQMRPYNVTVQ